MRGSRGGGSSAFFTSILELWEFSWGTYMKSGHYIKWPSCSSIHAWYSPYQKYWCHITQKHVFLKLNMKRNSKAFYFSIVQIQNSLAHFGGMKKHIEFLFYFKFFLLAIVLCSKSMIFANLQYYILILRSLWLKKWKLCHACVAIKCSRSCQFFFENRKKW